MRFVLTTCCAEKRTDPGLLPAAERYCSERIARARAEADRRGLPLLFLSGVHGVVGEADPLPWYDHALADDEVAALVPPVVFAFRHRGVDELVLVVRPRGTPGWAPYRAVLDAAVAELAISVVEVVVDVD